MMIGDLYGNRQKALAGDTTANRSAVAERSDLKYMADSSGWKENRWSDLLREVVCAYVRAQKRKQKETESNIDTQSTQAQRGQEMEWPWSSTPLPSGRKRGREMRQ